MDFHRHDPFERLRSGNRRRDGTRADDGSDHEDHRGPRAHAALPRAADRPAIRPNTDPAMSPAPPG